MLKSEIQVELREGIPNPRSGRAGGYVRGEVYLHAMEHVRVGMTVADQERLEDEVREALWLKMTGEIREAFRAFEDEILRRHPEPFPDREKDPMWAAFEKLSKVVHGT